MRITKIDIPNKDHELACKRIKTNWHLLDYTACKEFFESGVIYSGARALIYYRFFGENRLRVLLEKELNTDEKKKDFEVAVKTVLYKEIQRNMLLAFNLQSFLNTQKFER